MSNPTMKFEQSGEESIWMAQVLAKIAWNVVESQQYFVFFPQFFLYNFSFFSIAF
jgi:hypothetical protein